MTCACRIRLDNEDLKLERCALHASAPEMFAALRSVHDAYQQLFDVMPVAWQSFDELVGEVLVKAGGSL